jgi:hypothetical protein
MLGPRWFQPRIGPYLRRERDKREYFRLFSNRRYVGGLKREFILRTARRELVREDADPAAVAARQTTVFIFGNALQSNERRQFHHVYGHGPRLRQELQAITRRRYQPQVLPVPHVALHVRLGDFGRASSRESLKQGASNARLPFEWYADMLLGMRRLLGEELPAVLYSDGADEELGSLLRLPALRRAPRQESVTDLLSIAQASLLIGSGSGFSLWGAFLGQVPRLCFPGQRIVPAVSPAGAIGLEPECDMAEQIPAEFLAHMAQRIRGGC